MESNPRRMDLAYDLLHCVIEGQMPSDEMARDLFGSEAAGAALELISFAQDDLRRRSGKPRRHMASDFEIARIRRALESDLLFQAVQLDLLRNREPDPRMMSGLYGEFGLDVARIYAESLSMRATRKCGIPAVCHYNRVGGVARRLGLDTEGSRYAAIAALHDAIEDLSGRDLSSDHAYEQLFRHGEVVRELLPSELASSVGILTNRHDLVLSSIASTLASQGRTFSGDTVGPMLLKLAESADAGVARAANNILGSNYLDDLPDVSVKDLKWFCYIGFYLGDLAALTLQANDYRLFQIKAIDLLDNAHGSEALDTMSRIRVIRKMTAWAQYGYAFRSTWGPLNAHVVEVQETALRMAEELVVRDLVRWESKIDFVASAVRKIGLLKDVFYE
jgi:hypothetical protein